MLKDKFISGMLLVLFFMLSLLAIIIFSFSLKTNTLTYDTAQEVVQTYLAHSNFSGLEEQISSLQSRIDLSGKELQKRLRAEHNHVAQMALINTQWDDLCLNAHELIRDDVCKSISTIVFEWTYEKRLVDVIEIEILNQTHNESNIMVYYNTANIKKGEGGVHESTITYVLHKTDKWSIVDILTELGTSSFNAINIDTLNTQYGKTQERYRQIFDKTQSKVSKYSQLLEFKEYMKKKILQEDRFTLKEYYVDLQKGMYIVDVHYYYEPKIINDEFADFLQDSTHIFKAGFSNHGQIQQMQTTAYRKESEDIIGEALMTKETAQTLNWETYYGHELDQITDVKFYGESTLHDIAMLSNSLFSWKKIGGGLVEQLEEIGIIKDMPRELPE